MTCEVYTYVKLDKKNGRWVSGVHGQSDTRFTSTAPKILVHGLPLTLNHVL